MNKIIAKFNLTASKSEDGSMFVSGSAVASGSEENKSFAEFTPAGSLSMTISAGKEAQEQFEVGVTKEYFITISEFAEPKVEETTEE